MIFHKKIYEKCLLTVPTSASKAAVYRKVFLKIGVLQFHICKKTLVLWSLLKMRLRHSCFRTNIEKFKQLLWWLPLAII